MNREKLIRNILINQIQINPKGYASRLRLTHKRVLKWIQNYAVKINDNKHTIGEMVYWVIHGIRDIQLCDECRKILKNSIML